MAGDHQAKGALAVRHPNVETPAPTHAVLTPDEAEEAITLGLADAPKTELGRLLIAARREFFAREGRFLNRDELEREVAERRGGAFAGGED